MTELTIIALIAATPPTAAALASLFVSWRNRKNIQVIHLQINSRMDELIKASKGQSRSEGHIEGQELERSEERQRILDKG